MWLRTSAFFHTALVGVYQPACIRECEFGGLERQNGMVEWTTGGHTHRNCYQCTHNHTRTLFHGLKLILSLYSSV